MWFADAEDDETEYREEVEGVSCYTVESNQGAELADDDVYGSESSVEGHGIDGCEAEGGLITEDSGERFASPRAAA